MIADRSLEHDIVVKFLNEINQLMTPSLKDQMIKQGTTIEEYGIKLASKGTIAYEICNDGEVKGMIIGYAHDTPDNSSYITQVCVKEKFRREGIFKKLFFEYEAFVQALGIERIWLTTGKDNTAARKAYEKVGFKLDDEFLISKDSRTVKYVKDI